MKNANGLRTFLLITLVVSGLMAALAISAPEFVELGFYLLVIPGLMLMYAPIIFVVFAVFTVVWWLVSKGKGSSAGVLAGLIAVLAVVIVPPLLDGYRAKAALADVMQQSKMPAGPVTLAGDIWLKLPAASQYSAGARCSGLCMDLLDRPGVTAVTEELTTPNSASEISRYILLDSAAACEQVKADPSKSILVPQVITAYVAEGDNDTIYSSRKALFESGSACLVRETTQPISRDNTIEFDDGPVPIPAPNWSLTTNAPIGRDTLTIKDKAGKVLFFGGTWTKWSLALPLRTLYGRNTGKAAVGWDVTYNRVGDTQRSAQSLLYLAIFGKPQELAVD
jgi:hypothetical protein